MTDANRKLSLIITAIVSIIWSVAAISYIGAVTFIEVPIDNVRIVDQVLGFIMGTVVASVINFWLGSSIGSRSKDTTPTVQKDE